MKRGYPFIFIGLLSIGLAQANELENLLKDFLKDKLAPPPLEQSAPPAQSATSVDKPGEQLLKSLLGGKMSDAEEARIGRQIAGNLLGAAPLVRDDALQRYVNRVGRWVALQSERPDLDWTFGVIDSDAVNAFAAPGGYVFVTRGLYGKLQNEAELAGVLGHEIGHVISRHHLKLLQKSQGIAVLGGLLGRKLKDEHEVVQNLIGNGAEVFARGLDKAAENEADRIGVVLSVRAGYDGYALPAVLAEIGHVARNDQSVSLLFKTHPLPEDRLAHLSATVGEKLDAMPQGQTGVDRFYRLR
jgi:beta-barrel assembly-enhancing protease